jgi:hypothetical protein
MDSDLLISLEESIEAPVENIAETGMNNSVSHENLLDQPVEVLDPFAIGNFEVLKPTVLLETSEEVADFSESAGKESPVGTLNRRLSAVSVSPSDIARGTTQSNSSVRSLRPALAVKNTPASSRLNPTPPQVLPVHYNLPTRKWVDANIFCDIPTIDKLHETIAKAFSHQPANQRPQKTVITLSKALESPDAYATLIAANR